jgi:hypothetical protein
MCGKCWHQNLEELEKADDRVPWLKPIYESGGQESESLRRANKIKDLSKGCVHGLECDGTDIQNAGPTLN